jgi:hypothetical protein
MLMLELFSSRRTYPPSSIERKSSLRVVYRSNSEEAPQQSPGPAEQCDEKANVVQKFAG